MPWTSLLGTDVIDLRHQRSTDRVAMHAERPPFLCRGCGGPMHLRYYDQSTERDPDRFCYFTDKTGPFLAFVHNPGEAERCRALGFHTDESAEHLGMKHLLCEAATSKGWSAETEVHHELTDGRRCRADVVIHRAGLPSRVLEAQRSPLGTDEAARRTQLYQTAFGDVLWTHTKQRPWSRRLKSLRVDEDDISLVIGGVYKDQGCHDRIDDAPLVDVVGQILPPADDLYWVWAAEDFGGFVPRSMTPRTVRNSQHQRLPRAGSGRPAAGTAVQECDRLSHMMCKRCGETPATIKPYWAQDLELCGQCAPIVAELLDQSNRWPPEPWASQEGR